MKTSQTWVGTAAFLALTVVAGCGGSNNASPFNGTTNSNSLPDRSGVSSSRPTKSTGAIPVFLSVKPETITKDIWVRVSGFELQTAKSTQKIYHPSASWLRLSALRDVTGPRYLFLGMAERGDAWVRLQLNLGEDYRFTEVGDEKPSTESFGGTAANNGQGDRTLVLNLDPNAEFKDAIVAEISLEEADKKIAPKMNLGNADLARTPERQERSLWAGTVNLVDSEKESRYFRFKEAGKLVFATGTETFAGQTATPLTDNAKIWAWTYFDGAKDQIAVSAVFPASEGTPWAGRTLAYDAEKRTLMIEASQAGKDWNGLNAPIFSLAKDAWTAPVVDEKSAAPKSDQVVFVSGVLTEGAWQAEAARPDATVTVAAYRPATAKKPLADKKEQAKKKS